MNKQKLTDALTALETSTQLHKDAIGYSQRAIESNQLAVKLLTEAMIPETTNYEVQLKSPKHVLLNDDGLRVFATDDSYRKYIVDLAKEEVADTEKVLNRKVKISEVKQEDLSEAKKFILEERECIVPFIEEFHVNRKNRKVTCLVRGVKTGYVYSKGIAECAANDTFNEHIGKVIAFFRAIGVEVPELFTNVPNPEKIHNGDIIRHKNDSHGWEINNIVTIDDKIRADYHYETINYTNHLISKRGFDEFKVIDDSNRK